MRAAVAAIVFAAVIVAAVLVVRDDDDAGGPAPAVSEREDRAAERPAQEPEPEPERPVRRRRLTDRQAVRRVLKLTPYVTRGSARGKLVALTFDDGPGPQTAEFLTELRRLEAPATFFQVTQMAAARPDLARLEHRGRFAVGAHTLSHPHLDELGSAEQGREIGGSADAVAFLGGSYPQMFRPPYGEYDDATLNELGERRMLMVLWSVSPRDWSRPGVDEIVRRVLTRVRPGGIVLLHDAGGDRSQTLAALPRIVSGLRRRGYRLVTVPRLLAEAPPERRPKRPRSPYPG